MDGIAIFTIIVILLGYLAWHIYDNYRQSHITSSLEAYAKQNSLVFKFKDSGNNMLAMPFPRLFSVGEKQYINNIIEKQCDGYKVYWGDYVYITSSKNHNSTDRNSFVIFECEDLFLTDFYLHDESIIDTFINTKLGFQDINFDNDDYFSPKFILQGSNEDEVRALFTQRLRKAYAEIAGKGYQSEGSGHCFMLYSSHQLGDIKQREELEKRAYELFKVLMSENK